MLRIFRDYNYQQYSPLLFGIALTPPIYLILVLFAQPHVVVPKWLWLSGLPIIVAGAILQFSSNRVLWIRIYQVTVVLWLGVLALILLWVVLTKDQSGGYKLLAGVTIGIIVIGSVVATYQSNNAMWSNMPHGPTGVLDNQTGLVNPNKSPIQVQNRLDKAHRLTDIWRNFSSLAAGLAMFLVQVLPNSGITIMVAFVALIWTILGLVGVSRALYFVPSIIRWEREHGKQIYVMR